MAPFGSTMPLDVSKSSPTTAHQPTEKGLAEPQSIERKRSQPSGTAKGFRTCFALSQQSKNAPSMIDQSPYSQARTNAALPTCIRFAT
jgi:hypothetical protein